MGTRLSLHVEASDRPSALDASESAVREIERIESLLSTWKPGGPLARLNAAAPGEPVDVGAETAGLLGLVREWTHRTEGAFDPTVLPLIRAWDLRGGGRIPGRSLLARARLAAGWNGFRDLPEGFAWSRESSDAGIDEGAWGKGYALDGAARTLADAHVRSALVDLGGQVIVIGSDRVAIADPQDRLRTAAWIDVENASVSTSGNSERGKLVAGRRIGHLLDPRTGRPAPDFGSATATAPSAFVADVLSTAFFVLGPGRGLALSERLRREGIPNEVLFLVSTRGRPSVAASPQLRVHRQED